MNDVSIPPIKYDAEKDFTSLIAWKSTREVKKYFFSKILTKISDVDKWSLGHQIRRTLISISANIAEGYGRFHYQEGIQFYRISRASLYELKDHLISCLDFHIIDYELYENGIRLIENAKRILNGYIAFVQKQARNSK